MTNERLDAEYWKAAYEELLKEWPNSGEIEDLTEELELVSAQRDKLADKWEGTMLRCDEERRRADSLREQRDAWKENHAILSEHYKEAENELERMASDSLVIETQARENYTRAVDAEERASAWFEAAKTYSRALNRWVGYHVTQTERVTELEQRLRDSYDETARYEDLLENSFEQVDAVLDDWQRECSNRVQVQNELDALKKALNILSQ